jgi:hypothetical protein
MKEKVAQAAGIGSEAVAAKTGKTWDEWLEILDRAGARKWTHKEIARFLQDQWKCPPWWGQMITVGYEQERGLRVKNQLCSGEFSASASKTFAVPLSTLFRYWAEPALRDRWMPDASKITIRKATADKSMRITWADGTLVEINFTARGNDRSVAAVQHRKLRDQEQVTQRKSDWTGALAKLAVLLSPDTSSESPKPAKKPAARTKSTAGTSPARAARAAGAGSRQRGGAR